MKMKWLYISDQCYAYSNFR